MAEYIAKKAAINAVENAPIELFQSEWEEIEEAINAAPAADVVPVVHAKWIRTKTEEDDWGHSFHHWHCSACGWFEGSNPEGARKYCSGCGAKMEGVVDNA